MADVSLLTRKIGPLPGWQWAALAGSGAGLVWYIRTRGGSSSGLTPAGDAQIDPSTGLPYSSEYGPAGGGQVLAPIVIQQGPPSTGGNKGTSKKPPPKKGSPKTPGFKPRQPTTPRGKITRGKVNPGAFAPIYYGLSPQGRSMTAFATVRNGRIVGGNVGQSGAPVYALVNTQYGPVWRQGFDPKKLPSGTKIGTLGRFSGLVQRKASR